MTITRLSEAVTVCPAGVSTGAPCCGRQSDLGVGRTRRSASADGTGQLRAGPGNLWRRYHRIHPGPDPDLELPLALAGGCRYRSPGTRRPRRVFRTPAPAVQTFRIHRRGRLPPNRRTTGLGGTVYKLHSYDPHRSRSRSGSAAVRIGKASVRPRPGEFTKGSTAAPSRVLPGRPQIGLAEITAPMRRMSVAPTGPESVDLLVRA